MTYSHSFPCLLQRIYIYSTWHALKDRICTEENELDHSVPTQKTRACWT